MSLAMSARPFHALRSLAPILIINAGVSFSGVGFAQDRFIVPVPDSPPPSSPSSSSSSSTSSSSSSSSSGSSSSDSSSYTPPGDSGSSSSSRASDNRFNVPVPGERSSRRHSNPGPGYGGGSWRHDWYWAECYYWNGRYYYGNGYHYSPFGEGVGVEPGSNATRNVYSAPSGPNRLPIFFPPAPPPLDTPPPAPPMGEPMFAAPPELAAYISDPFYAPLSTRLAERNVTDALRRRLDSYQRSKVELQAELQARLASLSSVVPSTREAALQSFAREQASRLAALEAMADQLRTDFVRGGLVGLFSGSGDWNEHRTWRLGSGHLMRDSEETRTARFRIARAAVFYQDGLSPAQRRLLREIAMELQVQAFKPDALSGTDSTLVFFSPDTARVHLPADMPAALADKVAAWHAEKTTLKTQLRETLFQQDSATKSSRTQALKQLATDQAPRFVALERSAEEIRRDLDAHVHRANPDPTSALPPELASRLLTYQRNRAALQEAIRLKLDEISRILPANQFTIVQNLDSTTGSSLLTIELRPTSGSVERRQSVVAAVTAFNRERREQVAMLNQESASIRAAAAAFTAANPESLAGRSVDRLLQEYGRASVQKENRPRYEDYHTAVFQPGLSPEQRRLLFDAAVQKLALPLPAGELQP
jgi:hypothetical protein